jgi:hypothetical protein
MRGQVFVAATAMAAALLGAAQPASAQQYRNYHDAHVSNQYECRRSEANRTTGGAVIGGVLGALLGREVADRGVRGEGAALGAVVGAVAGGAVGRSTARCDNVPQGSYDPYNGQAYGQYPDQDPYRGNDGYYGASDDGYYQDDYRRECRTQEVTRRDRYGRRYRDEVYVCRDDDGVWRRAD